MLSLLRMRLHHAVSYLRTTVAMDASGGIKAGLRQTDSALTALDLPLKQTGKAPALIYTSPIAYRLATQPHQVAEIAAQVAEILLKAPDGVAMLPPGLAVQAVAGLIHFEVGDQAIAAWLDQLLDNALLPQPLSLVPIAARGQEAMWQSAAIFEAQHAHARCCSLLRLAHHEKLISLERLEEPPFYWRFNSPRSPPWFRAAHFALNHHADRCLILRLFEAVDAISDPSRQRTSIAMVRSAQTVAQAFQTFHRTHPLWQQTGTDSALAIAQLGLLMATQRILYLLLAEGLHLSPTVEL